MEISERVLREFDRREDWQFLRFMLGRFVEDLRDLLEKGDMFDPPVGKEGFRRADEVRGAIRTLRRVRDLPTELIPYIAEANENGYHTLEQVIEYFKENSNG